MEKNKKLNKTFILLLIASILIVVTIFLLTINFIHSLKDDSKSSVLYGVVESVEDNFIVLKPTDGGEQIIINTKDAYNTGSLLRIITSSKKSPYDADKIEVIIDNKELKTVEEDAKTSTTTTTVTTTTEVITSSLADEITTSTTEEISLEVDADTVVINSVKQSYNTIKESIDESEIKTKAKEYFILLVDFIFYDGEINGVKFNELTASAKAKVIYYTLLIDNKIEEKIPNYKSNLEDKYLDIKSKLLAKYMDLVSNICENNQDNCNNVKNDFNTLKSSISISWDFLKSVFKYCYDASVPKIVEWYEIFSGKR